MQFYSNQDNNMAISQITILCTKFNDRSEMDIDIRVMKYFWPSALPSMPAPEVRKNP